MDSGKIVKALREGMIPESQILAICASLLHAKMTVHDAPDAPENIARFGTIVIKELLKYDH